MMVLSGLKGEIGMSRKSVTANIAQSHIYGQAHVQVQLQRFLLDFSFGVVLVLLA